MKFPLKFSKKDSLRHLWWLLSERRMQRLPKNIFLLSLRQYHLSKYTKKLLAFTPPFFIFKKCDISSQNQQKRPSQTLSETRMHRRPKKMFLLSLRQNHFSKEAIKFLGPTPPFLYLKKCNISSQIQQKRPS